MCAKSGILTSKENNELHDSKMKDTNFYKNDETDNNKI